MNLKSNIKFQSSYLECTKKEAGTEFEAAMLETTNCSLKTQKNNRRNQVRS